MPRDTASAPPVASHNFRVSIGSGKSALQLGFMRVEFPSFVLPGMKPAEPDAAPPLLVLRRGWDGNSALADWWNQARKNTRTRPRDVSVELLAAAAAETTLRWDFSGCRPLALHYSALDAMQSAVLIESLSVAFDEVELSTPKAR